MTEKNGKKSPLQGFKDDNVRGAQRDLLEELFYDIYVHRKQVYLVNFFRGISFGVGSVIGGTIFLAIFLWLMSQFVDWFPILGDFVRGITDAATKRQ
jgi:hypothetical protein